jgi:hypothetical protein
MKSDEEIFERVDPRTGRTTLEIRQRRAAISPSVLGGAKPLTPKIDLMSDSQMAGPTRGNA